MKRVTKREVSITVKLTDEEWQMLQSAADSIWPGAPITKASIVAGLAKMAAKDLLAAKDSSPRKPAKKT